MIRRMRTALPILAVVLLSASMASAQAIYRWVDEQGEVHYTDDKESIPEAQRPKAKQTKGSEIGLAPSPDGPRESSKRRSRPRAEESIDPDQAAKAAAEAQVEQAWRARFREAHDRIADLERTLAKDRKTLENPGSAGLPLSKPDMYGRILPSAEFEQVRERVASGERRLAQAREALADLEREAAREAVPLEWRR